MSFLAGRPYPADGDGIEIDEQPTQPLPMRICPVCLYYRETRGEHVEVGVAQLRVCPDHMAALNEEADWQTRLVLRDQMRRAFNWYFWPAGYQSTAKHLVQRLWLDLLDDRAGDDYGNK